MRRAVIGVLLLLALLAPRGARAAEGGSGNYAPGFYGDFGMAFLPEPGTFFNNWLSYYHGTFSPAVPGLALDLDYKTNTVVEAPGIIHVPQMTVLGGHLGMAAFLPLVYTEATETISGPGIRQRKSEARFGLGDMYLVPLGILWNFGDFNLLAYEGFIAPTGSYDRDRLLNTGRNYWSFDSNIGFTWLDQRGGHEVSSMIGYMANTTNGATDYRSGNDFHLDYLIGQYVSERFAVGVTGSYYKQVNGDSGDGAILGGFMGRGNSIGPALLLTVEPWGKQITFTTKWLHEFEVKNRFAGDFVYLLLVAKL